MPTPQQQKANHENAQKSTGPVTPEGKLKSSLNSTKHGFTGKELFLTPGEQKPYEEFSAAMHREIRAGNAETRELLQHYINLRWSLNQILVHQTNLLAIIDQITSQFISTGDITGLAKAVEPHYRQLRTLGTYEQRRRKAAQDSLDRFQQLEKAHRAKLEQAASAHETMKKLGQTWNPAEFGFDCSLQEIERFLDLRDNAALLAELRKDAGLGAKSRQFAA
jgi:hypothetical protein